MLLKKEKNKWCRIYFETIFTQKVLINVTNYYKKIVTQLSKREILNKKIK